MGKKWQWIVVTGLLCWSLPLAAQQDQAGPPGVEEKQKPSQNETPAGVETHETLSATLWVQQSVEFQALSRQTFELAKRQLDRALANPQWSASLEQRGNYGLLPPAVILDVDETVLDNAPYQARRILVDGGYDDDEFSRWSHEAQAKPIPGAVEFTQYAADRGVAVFYVSNRHAKLKESTLKNLQMHGFPVGKGTEQLLFAAENEWTSDKTARRKVIAESYRILLLIGDDFNDFVFAKTNGAERQRLLGEYGDFFGDRWIVLPNPVYGSWNSSATNLSVSSLDTMEPADP